MTDPKVTEQIEFYDQKIAENSEVLLKYADYIDRISIALSNMEIICDEAKGLFKKMARKVEAAPNWKGQNYEREVDRFNNDILLLNIFYENLCRKRDALKERKTTYTKQLYDLESEINSLISARNNLCSFNLYGT